MKRKLEYESEKVLPEELSEIIKKLELNILRDRNESDKILCHIGHLRYDLVVWFSNKEIKDGTK